MKNLETAGNKSGQLVEGCTSKYVLPTTFAQQRLWFLDKLQPGGTSYLIPWALRVGGQLNLAALEASLNEVVKRNEILRTTFSWQEGMPMQVVHASMNIRLSLRDLSQSKDGEKEALELARDEAHTPLDLERGPLVRARLIRLAADDHLLLLTVHHIIFDGWSRRILVRELAASYEAYCSGQAPSFRPPKLQYADYAVWQRKRFQGSVLEKHLAYWRERLKGIPGRLELPFSRPRPLTQTFNGAKLAVAFSRELTKRLNCLSREQGVTLFMTLLAGFQSLLWRYSHQNEIVVGTPIANRNRAEIEEIIGLFTNTLVLRTNFSEQLNFRQVLAAVKETTLGAYEHQDLPFEKLVEELHPERNLGHNPLFQVMFSVQNLARPDFELSGAKLSFMDTGEITTKFDLSVFLSETGNGIEGRIEYNRDLFDESPIRRMIEHYRLLLEAAVNCPDAKVAEVSLLTAEERTQILRDWNSTATAYPRNLGVHDLIEQQAKRAPKRVALVMGGDEITYRELNARANQLAHYLRQRGVGPENLVGIFLERSINMVVALLGVLKAGGAYLPLDPAYPPERIGFIVEDAGVPLLLTETDLLSLLPPSPAKVIDLVACAGEISAQPKEPPTSPSGDENLAYVLYTSGSTGGPKGVQITHGNLINFLVSMQRQPGLQSNDRLLAVTTLSFDIAGLEIYLPLISGARILIASRPEATDGRLLLKLIESQKPTLMQATPATWRMLIEAGWTGTPNLKVLCGGEALSGDLTSQLLPRCRELWNMYGPTETTIWSSLYQVRSAVVTAPIGRPIANTTLYILDSQMQPVPVGVAGDLYIGGAGVARGYLNRPELTAAKFVRDRFDPRPEARLYRTGDVARYLPDGNVQYLGRSDFQVKIRGFRIELAEIENALLAHPAVEQAVVVAREDSPGDKRLVAYIVRAAGEQLTISEARPYLKRTLPDYMLPAALVELERLPLTPNGKVDQKALPKPTSTASAAAARVEPRNQLEEKLVKIWQEILSTEAIGITDNFFDLGGHSLLAVRLVNEIKNVTGADIPLTALFQEATIEHLAKIIRGAASVSKALAQPIQASGSRPPFFAAVLSGVNPLGYVPLAKHLGPDQPFYTLQSPGPGPHATMRSYTPQEYENVASEYVRAMQVIQPRGPYHIGGTCEGARIAFEMTRILEARGETVNLLAIFDTWVLENSQNPKLWRVYYYSQRLRGLWHQSWHARLAAVRKALRTHLLSWIGSKSAPRKSEWLKIYWPGEDFVPQRIEGRITVFKIPKQPYYYNPDPLLGWGARTQSGVDTYLIPNGRHRLLLREPYVRELAKALSESLKKCQATTEASDEPAEKNAEPDAIIAAAQAAHCGRSSY